jgi:hypothetical protein
MTRIATLRPALLIAVSAAGHAGCGGVTLLDRDHHEARDVATASSCAGRTRDVELAITTGGGHVGAVAPGPSCGTFAGGSYFGEVATIGGTSLPAVVDWDGWAARLDADGNALWTLHFASEGGESWTDQVTRFVASDDGDAWVFGYAGRVDLAGTGVLEGPGAFALAVDPTGAPRWSRRLDGYPVHTALRPDGAIEVYYEDSGVRRALFDGEAGFTLSDEAVVEGAAGVMSASTAAGRTALALCFNGSITIGDHVLTASDDALDGNGNQTCDLALAVLSDRGELLHGSTFVEHGFSPYLVHIAIDDRGAVAMNGSFWGRIDLGGGELVASPIGEGMRGLFASFDAEGNTVASRAFGDAWFVFSAGVAWGDASTIALGGTLYHGAVDLGGGPIRSIDDYAGFERSVDASGGYLSSAPHAEHSAMIGAGSGEVFWVDQAVAGTSDGVVVIARSAIGR